MPEDEGFPQVRGHGFCVLQMSVDTSTDPSSGASRHLLPQGEKGKIERLKKRRDFLAAAQALSVARGAVVIQARPRADGDALIRVGFTATRKIGGAVVRNRAKRRLREAARRLVPELGRPGFDYVMIARGGTPGRAWERLLDDVKSALIRLAADSEAPRAPNRA